MKIVVLIKQVPDTATQVKIGSDGRQIDTAGITWIVSPYDEFAVEEALRNKEKRGQGEVVAEALRVLDDARRTLRDQLGNRSTPAVLRIELGRVLQHHQELDLSLLEKLLDFVHPTQAGHSIIRDRALEELGGT